jgi:alpha-1,3-fucosyltransferase
MPPKSYIDVNAFATVEDLANHLKFLASNPDEYVKYFWWKKYYKIVREYNVCHRQLCRICKSLHERKATTNIKTQVYGDIKKWNLEGMCRNATIKF